ncbi:MAG: alpha-amylase, partial [Bacteroidota bacterium]|nr:alpha-amylase [Bacteroidota bacterium]
MIKNKIVFTLITLCFLFLELQVVAQNISSEPALPTSDQSVTVFFDATDTPLENYSGTLYAHTGVILEGSASWSHVIGDWGSSNQPQLEALGDNRFKLEITPDIDSYYSINDGESVAKMSFVFRSQDGNTQSEDLFINVFESGLKVSFQKPELPQLVSEGETIEIEISANDCDSLFFKVDDDFVIQTEGTSISTTIEAFASGKHNLIAIAKNTEGNYVYDSTFYLVKDANTVEAMPLGIRKGINYINDETVTLVLYAPYKNFVFVIGDFNNWEYDNSYLMKKDPDGKHFWLTIEGLNPGQEYVYQYLIDGELKIADPYTDKVSDPNMDKYISESVYPNLIDYPENKTQGNAAVLQTAQQEYQWEVDDFVTPKKEDLVIYELLVRDFTANGDYKTVADTFDYLQRLGINAIELMPVNEFEG